MIETRPTPWWLPQTPKGSFISYNATYGDRIGKYFDRFNKDSFKCNIEIPDGTFDKIDYYFHDPRKYGFDPNKKYPLLIFIHGLTNALQDESTFINYSGAEFFATQEYQDELEGAFILVPKANEYNDNEVCKGSWSDGYIDPLYNTINDFIDKYAKNSISKISILAASKSLKMTYKLVVKYPELFDIFIELSSNRLPNNSEIEIFNKNDIFFFYALCKHDELNDYEIQVKPYLKNIKKINKHFIFLPDWIYHGNKGIASGYELGRFEMGQHCLIVSFMVNLLFDDGTPMYDKFPKGFLNWFKTIL